MWSDAYFGVVPSLAFVSSSSTTSQVPIFTFLGISPLLPSAPRFIPVLWQPPSNHWFKANSDGSFHDIDHAGFGGVFRDCNAEFLGTFTYGCVLTALLMQSF